MDSLSGKFPDFRPFRKPPACSLLSLGFAFKAREDEMQKVGWKRPDLWPAPPSSSPRDSALQDDSTSIVSAQSFAVIVKPLRYGKSSFSPVHTRARAMNKSTCCSQVFLQPGTSTGFWSLPAGKSTAWSSQPGQNKTPSGARLACGRWRLGRATCSQPVFAYPIRVF